MDQGSRWVAGAIAETALPGTAWGLVELELLEYFAEILAESYPKLCGAAPGEIPYDELLEEVACHPASHTFPSPLLPAHIGVMQCAGE